MQSQYMVLEGAIKVEKILKGSLDFIPSHSPLVKIQIMTRKFAWGVKAGGVNFCLYISIFTEGEGDGMESGQATFLNLFYFMTFGFQSNFL